MSTRKATKPPSGFEQLPLDFSESSASAFSSLPTVVIPVETTFDVSQGMREGLTFWEEQKTAFHIIFNCRHLELAESYVVGESEVFDSAEVYLIGRGGLINTAVFINLLRCCQSLETWSMQVQQNTGDSPIRSIRFEPPDLSTKVGKLWKNLAFLDTYDPSNPPHVEEFQSRYITPILWVTRENEQEVLQQFVGWLLDISDRLGDPLKDDLIKIAIEVITNLVKYGFNQSYYGVSIWPSGQVEIVWSNSIAHLKDWPPEETAQGIITGLQASTKGGAGMDYILHDVLPRYHGLLAINCKGNDLFFHASRKYSVFSQYSPDREMLLPTSILFTLHLFCPTTRRKSEEHKS
jgi:hypothetical protein